MALTRVQRQVIEECVRKLEKGPGRGWDEPDPFTKQPRTAAVCKVWAQSWIQGPLEMLLENDAGRLSARELKGRQ